jgi:hypothetical protein
MEAGVPELVFQSTLTTQLKRKVRLSVNTDMAQQLRLADDLSPVQPGHGGYNTRWPPRWPPRWKRSTLQKQQHRYKKTGKFLKSMLPHMYAASQDSS